MTNLIINQLVSVSSLMVGEILTNDHVEIQKTLQNFEQG